MTHEGNWALRKVLEPTDKEKGDERWWYW
jgi:hypothetical protein